MQAFTQWISGAEIGQGNLLLEDGDRLKERCDTGRKRMRQNAYMRAIAQYYPDKLNNSIL